MNGYDSGPVELLDLTRFRLDPDEPEFEQFVLADEHEMSELAVALELNEHNIADASAFEQEQVRATGALLYAVAQELGIGSESLVHAGLDEALASIADADDSTREAWAELPVEAWLPAPGELIAPDEIFLPPAPDDTELIRERPPLADLPLLTLWGDFSNQAQLLGDWLIAANLPIGEFPVGGSSKFDSRINELVEQLRRVDLTSSRRWISAVELARLVNERGQWVLDPEFWYDPNTRAFRPRG